MTVGRLGMDRVTPPESTDWIDAVVGSLVIVGGTFLAIFAVGVLT
jgi:hypothetical protein